MRSSSAWLRWVGSASLAGVLTVTLFLGMVRLVDANALVGRLFRLFPLSETVVSEEECLDLVPVRREATIRGEVGFYRNGRFVPLEGGTVFWADGSEEAPLSRTSPSGGFEFVTHFATGRPASCGEAPAGPEPESRQLGVRAPGCEERRVPLTPAWVPHRIILECDGGEGPSPARATGRGEGPSPA